MAHHEKCLEGARRKLEEKAMQFARMKALGRYFHNGSDVSVGNDRGMYLDEFSGQLEQAAMSLFAEVAATPLPERLPKSEPLAAGREP